MTSVEAPEQEAAGTAPVPRSSELLRTIVGQGAAPRVAVGEIVDGLRDRAYGLLFILLALPNVLPAPPGLGGAFGLVMAVFAVQLILGAAEPRLPRFVRRWSFPRPGVQRLLVRAQPFLSWLERYCRPRWGGLASRTVERLIGSLVLLLAFAIALPLPMTGAPPAIAVIVLALGLLERDGAAILLGALAALAALAIVSLALSFYAVSLHRIADYVVSG
jgi:hypothetical protein